jgi:hypothetical protein
MYKFAVALVQISCPSRNYCDEEFYKTTLSLCFALKEKKKEKKGSIAKPAVTQPLTWPTEYNAGVQFPANSPTPLDEMIQRLRNALVMATGGRADVELSTAHSVGKGLGFNRGLLGVY